ncbi:MAG: ABC transporter substrate-binding protein, partial [Armatimonadota bacterium]
MTKNFGGAFLGIVLLFAVGLLISSSSAVGKGSTTPIVIGAIFTITGDNAPLGVPERDTVLMLAKKLNVAGGINGRHLKVEVYDDAGKPEQAVQACNRLLARKDVVALI